MNFFKNSALICLVILFFSCSTDDVTENAQASEDSLVGTWNLTKTDVDGTANVPGVPIGIPVTAVGKDINAKVVLTTQPNNITASGNLVVTTSVNIPGNPVTQDIPINLDAFVGNGTWSVNNGQLIITDNVGSQTFDIKEFDANNLKITTEDEFPVPLNGTNVIVDATIEMVFQK